MESAQKPIDSEKPNWEINFDSELDRLTQSVRPRILQPEFVRPLKVCETLQVPGVFESIIERKGDVLDFSPFFVGPDTARTQDAVMQGIPVESVYVASSTDGRAVRLDFNGATKNMPGHEIIDSVSGSLNVVTSNESKGILVEGYVTKASGATFGFDQLRTQSVAVSGGVIGQKEQFGSGRVVSDARGEGKFNDLNEEKEYLLRYLNLGARVDIPIVLGRLDEPKARKDSGILVLAYRTPFNFENFQRIPNRDYDQVKYLIMHGISIWKREGLIDFEELAPLFSEEPIGRNQRLEQIGRLFRFYVKNGSKIAGEDLAKIHQIRFLDNRNPQNMGNDFGHRDVSDFPGPHPFDKLLPSGKYEDMRDDLGLIRNLILKLKPESEQNLFSVAVQEYMESYFSCGLGMSPKEFGLNLLKDVIKMVGFVDQTQLVMIRTFRQMAKEGFFKNLDKNNQGI